MDIQPGAAARLRFGTPGYMAPEQILGKTVDARCDLYALGCILFKLLTGRTPFANSEPKQVYRDHLEQPPPRLSMFYKDVPEGLQRLLDRLLAKSPQQRMGYAMDVAAWLADIGADDEHLPGPPPRIYLYSPGFVGREAWLRRVMGHVMAPGMAPSLLCLEGESGVGKTRLLVEVIQRAMARGLPVFLGRCPAPVPGREAGSHVEPLSPLRQPLRALAARCWERGPEETRRIFGRWRLDVLASFAPAQ